MLTADSGPTSPKSEVQLEQILQHAVGAELRLPAARIHIADTGSDIFLLATDGRCTVVTTQH